MTELQISKKTFNEVYLPYLTDYSHKFEILYGGSGSGKSHFIASKIILKCLKYSDRKVLIVRKTLVSQRDSCWRLILDILEKWQIKDLCKVNKTEYSIELPTGSVLLFKGLDDPEKIKSIVNITDCWCEEATELTAEDFEQLVLRVRALRNWIQIFVTFNPISKANWVYKRWFVNPQSHQDRTLILRTTYKDNKFLPEDYIKSLENLINTNPTYYKIYALGEFCSLERLVYNNWHKEQFDYHDIKGELLIGLDFGFSADTTALIASILDEQNKKIYIFKEWGDTGKTNPDIAKAITALGFNKSVIIADSAEPKSIEELKRLGIYRIRPSVKGQDSIIHGIQKLQQYELIVNPGCTNTITELENYSWVKDKDGNYTNKPIDSFNHYLDALRYSLQCVDKRLSSIDKKLLSL